ncbi:hypothetical protein SLS60_000299 [Paraconiothyrium brasiliense]|uniref:MFS transporter n=1 Tax=Paraconiothyrium brasiliense TaxID=300254 RepID=A0ABR3S5V5_9PLEO
MLGFTATRTQVATYLFGVALFSISFLVFLNSSISFVITQRIGQAHNVGDAVGTLGFADELVALVACPAWGLLSDRVGVRSVAVIGYTIVGVSLWVFMAAKNVYPQLLLARLLFSVGATATATMVTAILPTMTVVQIVQDPRTPRRRVNGTSHALAPSISSELTITPARFQSRSPPRDDLVVKKDTAASTSHLAGLVGMFTGCGALVALLIFLPLPTRFGQGGAEPAAAVADAFYIVGAIAVVVALGCFLGLRHLPGEEEKSWKRSWHTQQHKSSDAPQSRQRILSYPRLFWESVRLGYQSPTIGLGYVGGFVARASSVAISLFIPLFTNTHFLKTGQCRVTDPSDPADIKNSCPQAYKLAAMLTGISQLIALLSAPIFGYLSARYRKYNIPLMLAAIAGVAGYSTFGSLASPDPASKDGSGGIFAIVALLGISQIGAIVCSLALLGRGINDDDSGKPQLHRTDDTVPINGHLSPGATPPRSPAATPLSEEAPLLGTSYSRPTSSSGPETHTHLKGSIAGTYSLLGGFGILLLTKAGGALFDSSGPGAPFYMMAGFNALLLAQVIHLKETGDLPKEISDMITELHNALGNRSAAVPPRRSKPLTPSFEAQNPPLRMPVIQSQTPGDHNRVVARRGDQVVVYGWAEDYTEAIVFNTRNETTGRISGSFLDKSQKEVSDEDNLYLITIDEIQVALGHVKMKAGDYIRVWNREDGRNQRTTGLCFNMASGQIGKLFAWTSSLKLVN